MVSPVRVDEESGSDSLAPRRRRGGKVAIDGATAAGPLPSGVVTTTIARPDETESTASIEHGRPSYSWQFGQDRRLEMIREFAPLEGARVLDIGCGIGTYVKRFRQFSDEVHGVDVEAERVAEASLELPNITSPPARPSPTRTTSSTSPSSTR